ALCGDWWVPGVAILLPWRLRLEARTTPCTRGSPRQGTCSIRWHGEPILSCPRTLQHRCHLLQPVQRKTPRLAQVGGAELALAPAVGFPVPAPASIARLLLACPELAGGGTKGERLRALEPGIPGRGAEWHDLFVSLLLIAQGVACD